MPLFSPSLVREKSLSGGLNPLLKGIEVSGSPLRRRRCRHVALHWNIHLRLLVLQSCPPAECRPCDILVCAPTLMPLPLLCVQAPKRVVARQAAPLSCTPAHRPSSHSSRTATPVTFHACPSASTSSAPDVAFAEAVSGLGLPQLPLSEEGCMVSMVAPASRCISRGSYSVVFSAATGPERVPLPPSILDLVDGQGRDLLYGYL
jgi:hypothetical protein